MFLKENWTLYPTHHKASTERWIVPAGVAATCLPHKMLQLYMNMIIPFREHEEILGDWVLLLRAESQKCKNRMLRQSHDPLKVRNLTISISSIWNISSDVLFTRQIFIECLTCARHQIRILTNYRSRRMIYFSPKKITFTRALN